MSYRQITDLKINKNNDFKNLLLKTELNFQTVKLNDNLCIQYKKDKWYYVVEDVAIWSKCGTIKTVLFLKLRSKPKGKIKTFHGKEQFIFNFKNKHAIYSVQVYGRNDYNPNIITHVGFTKVPNLQECSL